MPQQRRAFLPLFTILKEKPFTPPPAYASPLPSTSKEEPQKEPQEKPQEEPQEGILGFSPKYDTKLGIYKKAGSYFIGDEEVEETTREDGNQYITIGEKDYLLTEGLKELLKFKKPKQGTFTGNDIAMYSKILVDTNTMYVKNDPKTGKLKLYKN